MPRTATVFVLFLASTLAVADGQDAPSLKQKALSLKPVQADVEYDQVPADEFDRCRVEDLDYPGWAGWLVRDADGTPLRRFADTNDDKKIDLWCYFREGVEVYRDVDADFNAKADQYRWLGTAGTRWAVDEDEDGTIDRWKQISAEEVTAELVASIADGDAARFGRLLIEPNELKSLGFTGDRASELADRVKFARSEFAGYAERQKDVSPDARWVQFVASKPGVVPSGTDGLEKDLTVYENAVAMFEQQGKSGQLLAGTLLRVGDTWRLISLPHSVGDQTVVARSSSFFFHSPSAAGTAAAGGPAGGAAASQELVTSLEQIDRQLTAASDPKALATLNERRADVVEKLVAAAASEEERATWVRQLVDTVAAAVQSGTYPQGLKRLEQTAKQFADDDAALQSYIAFQIVSADYALRLGSAKPEEFPKVQEWYLESLNAVVDRYPKSPEAALAMMQLALSKEFEDKEKEALEWYRKVAERFPNQEAGEKAAGAIHRLESVGQQLELGGTTLDGKSLSLSQLRGRPIVVHYWATWCEPCKQDLKLLRQLQARYQKAGLQLVGVNVDGRKADALAFVKANSLPWPQLFAEGGLESSPLAKQLGIQTLPTMLLIDKTGKVVRHNVQAAQLDAALEELAK